jgi:hypothetical protein
LVAQLKAMVQGRWWWPSDLLPNSDLAQIDGLCGRPVAEVAADHRGWCEERLVLDDDDNDDDPLMPIRLLPLFDPVTGEISAHSSKGM